MKEAEIVLAYYKQGDDMAHCLQSTDNCMEALISHASLLESCANQLKSIAEVICHAKDVTLEGDTHMITISGPDEVIDKLLEKELVNRTIFEEFDEEDDEFDEEEELEDDEDF